GAKCLGYHFNELSLVHVKLSSLIKLIEVVLNPSRLFPSFAVLMTIPLSKGNQPPGSKPGAV
ncbi:MAG TPA: hypothetical protein PKN59_08470, partial [Syntrophales bacterium]|nr:hypothetical protein [Syntrophales bacterium]